LNFSKVKKYITNIILLFFKTAIEIQKEREYLLFLYDKPLFPNLIVWKQSKIAIDTVF